jgi:hypothetical protein
MLILTVYLYHKELPTLIIVCCFVFSQYISIYIYFKYFEVKFDDDVNKIKRKGETTKKQNRLLFNKYIE